MKKIPTLFVRDENSHLVTETVNPGCEWVLNGEGVATAKIDGACCMIREGKLFKRRELRSGTPYPKDFEPVEYDPNTEKTFGWVLVENSPEDKYFREAWEAKTIESRTDGTYELIGPKINKNSENYPYHRLIKHGSWSITEDPRTFEEIKFFLSENDLEGIVWHHPDGRMVKIKKRDFGFRR